METEASQASQMSQVKGPAHGDGANKVTVLVGDDDDDDDDDEWSASPTLGIGKRPAAHSTQGAAVSTSRQVPATPVGQHVSCVKLLPRKRCFTPLVRLAIPCVISCSYGASDSDVSRYRSDSVLPQSSLFFPQCFMCCSFYCKAFLK